MKVVIAPDSFKESLTAKQVSEAIPKRVLLAYGMMLSLLRFRSQTVAKARFNL